MRELTLREQILIGLMLILMVSLAGVWVNQRVVREQERLELQLESRKRQLQEARQLSQEWSALQQKATAPLMQQPLSSFVESVARAVKIQDHLQLNALPNAPEGTEGVQVRLDQLLLEDLMEMLYRLENNRPVLKLSQLDLSISPGSRLVRASFQVHKQSGS
jgi:type II secretory pathway component PulM